MRSILLLILFYFFTSVSFSQTDSSYSFLRNLSIEELLELEIFSASKKYETSLQAPARVTLYSKNDLRNYGLFTLSDLANITPGYSSYTIYGEKVFETRGQKAGSFNNNKHLVLIDGIPINHARALKANTEEELPLFFAEKVEFLRGAASALYGTSAFFGVVNISTPKIFNGTSGETRISLGTHNSNKKIMSNFYHKNERSEYKLNIGYFEKDASKAYVGLIRNDANRFFDDQRSFFLNLSQFNTEGNLKGLGFGMIIMQKNGGLGEHWMHGNFSHEINDLTWRTFIFYTKYQNDIFPSLNLRSFLKYNKSSEKGVWAIFDLYSYENYEGEDNIASTYNIVTNEFEWQCELDWTPKFADFIIGANINMKYNSGTNEGAYNYFFSADPGSPFPPELEAVKRTPLFKTYSLYIQGQKHIDFLEGLRITAGIRNDYGLAMDEEYFQVSPRLGIVLKTSRFFNLKILYSTALRVPGLKEILLNNEAKAINENIRLADLKPEKIYSFETGVDIIVKDILLNLTYFHNETSNSLDGVRMLNENVFINSSNKITGDGIELELHFIPQNNVKFYLNYSYALAKDSDEMYLYDVPSQKGNIGLSYGFFYPTHINFSVIGRWVKDFRVGDNLLDNPDGYFIIDFNSVFSLTKKVEAEIQIENLLDKKYKLPKTGIPDIPMPGRVFNFSVMFKL